MSIAQSTTRQFLMVFSAALLTAACTNPGQSMSDEHSDSQTSQGPSMCEEHMGGQVTVYSEGFPTTRGEMFYCYGDSGFMIVKDDDTVISFPYHRVVAIQTTSEDFLAVTPK